MKFRHALAALFSAALLVTSCGGGDDGGNPMDMDPEPPIRNTPGALLTNWFERAYNEQNIAFYTEMLSPDFQFHFIAEDAESLRTILGSENFWGKASDLQSTTAMFGADSVTTVLLDINVSQNSEYLGDDCDGCREIQTTVVLRVTTEPTGATEPLVYTVDAPQIFITKPDPDSTGLWLLFRQNDQANPAPIAIVEKIGGGDAREIASNEERTWGQVKGIFF